MAPPSNYDAAINGSSLPTSGQARATKEEGVDDQPYAALSSAAAAPSASNQGVVPYATNNFVDLSMDDDEGQEKDASEKDVVIDLCESDDDDRSMDGDQYEQVDAYGHAAAMKPQVVAMKNKNEAMGQHEQQQRQECKSTAAPSEQQHNSAVASSSSSSVLTVKPKDRSASASVQQQSDTNTDHVNASIASRNAQLAYSTPRSVSAFATKDQNKKRGSEQGPVDVCASNTNTNNLSHGMAIDQEEATVGKTNGVGACVQEYSARNTTTLATTTDVPHNTRDGKKSENSEELQASEKASSSTSESGDRQSRPSRPLETAVDVDGSADHHSRRQARPAYKTIIRSDKMTQTEQSVCDDGFSNASSNNKTTTTAPNDSAGDLSLSKKRAQLDDRDKVEQAANNKRMRMNDSQEGGEWTQQLSVSTGAASLSGPISTTSANARQRTLVAASSSNFQSLSPDNSGHQISLELTSIQKKAEEPVNGPPDNGNDFGSIGMTDEEKNEDDDSEYELGSHDEEERPGISDNGSVPLTQPLGGSSTRSDMEEANQKCSRGDIETESIEAAECSKIRDEQLRDVNGACNDDSSSTENIQCDVSSSSGEEIQPFESAVERTSMNQHVNGLNSSAGRVIEDLVTDTQDKPNYPTPGNSGHRDREEASAGSNQGKKLASSYTSTEPLIADGVFYGDEDDDNGVPADSSKRGGRHFVRCGKCAGCLEVCCQECDLCMDRKKSGRALSRSSMCAFRTCVSHSSGTKKVYERMQKRVLCSRKERGTDSSCTVNTGVYAASLSSDMHDDGSGSSADASNQNSNDRQPTRIRKDNSDPKLSASGISGWWEGNGVSRERVAAFEGRINHCFSCSACKRECCGKCSLCQFGNFSPPACVLRCCADSNVMTKELYLQEIQSMLTSRNNRCLVPGTRVYCLWDKNNASIHASE